MDCERLGRITAAWTGTDVLGSQRQHAMSGAGRTSGHSSLQPLRYEKHHKHVLATAPSARRLPWCDAAPHLMPWAPHNAGEHCPGCIVPSKARLDHAGPIVADQGRHLSVLCHIC